MYVYIGIMHIWHSFLSAILSCPSIKVLLYRGYTNAHNGVMQTGNILSCITPPLPKLNCSGTTFFIQHLLISCSFCSTKNREKISRVRIFLEFIWNKCKNGYSSNKFKPRHKGLAAENIRSSSQRFSSSNNVWLTL